MMRISVISFTQNGDRLSGVIGSAFAEEEVIRTVSSNRGCTLSEWTENAFKESNAIIFVGAAGIAVRAIAPYVRSKDKDPAVIVTDEKGGFVIPLLSGHIGGANRLARRIAAATGGTAVITTATDINGVWAADEWAVENGCAVYNKEEIKHISGAMLRGERVGILSRFPVCGELPAGTVSSESGKYGVVISDKPEYPFEHTLVLIPKVISIGAGSRAGAEPEELISLYRSSRERLGFEQCAVEFVATIDIKRGEKSIEQLSEHIGCGIRYYSAAELNSAEGSFTGSDFVKKVTGVDNVCERAASMNGGRLILKKLSGRGVTLSAARREYTVKF